MDMEIIMILLIWLVAPFAEAGVIIGLAIANGRHKKRIQGTDLSAGTPEAVWF